MFYVPMTIQVPPAALQKHGSSETNIRTAVLLLSVVEPDDLDLGVHMGHDAEGDDASGRRVPDIQVEHDGQ